MSRLSSGRWHAPVPKQPSSRDSQDFYSGRRNEVARTTALSTFKAMARQPSPARSSRFGITEHNTCEIIKPYSLSAGYTERAAYESEESEQIALTFDLLKTMTPKSCVKCLGQTPLFLKTMVTEGQLDPDIVSSVSLSLTQNELQRFMLNMTQEVNFYNAFYACPTIQEVEQTIVRLVPMVRATVWLKASEGDFVVSPTLKTVLLIGKSIVTAPFENGEDIVTGDPGDLPSFCIDSDLPLLRGCKSMVLLPILDANRNIKAVLQCVGFKDSDDIQVPFTDYYIEVLKVMREIVKRKFFGGEEKQTIPANSSAIFNDIEKCSLVATVNQIGKFLQSSMPCEAVDIFEYDDAAKALTRLVDGRQFTEDDGGISFKAAPTSQTINIPHGQALDTLKDEIDTRLSNRSVLVQSLLHMRKKYVITCRAKLNALAFTTTQVESLSSLAPMICDAVRLAKWLEGLVTEMNTLKQRMKLLGLANDAITAVASFGHDKWETLRNASNQFFGSEKVLIALFDGRNMRFMPSNVRCKFEDCTAGTAYNHRECVIGKVDDENSRFNKELYRQLGEDNVQSTIAFPYRSGGRVAGAIEIMNPKGDHMSGEDQKLFSNLVACILTGKDFEV